MKAQRTSTNPAAMAWVAFGGLLALGFAYIVARELPSIRRELRLMRM
jgi:hypothetical protein